MKSIRVAAVVFIWLAWLFLLMMWPLSHRLSSAGIEFEKKVDHQIQNQWYGVVYPGTGVVMAGGETTYQPDLGQHYDAFDLGGAWLLKPFEDQSRTFWERAGFVWQMAPGRHWIGIPAWLAAAIAGVLPIKWMVHALKRRKQRRT